MADEDKQQGRPTEVLLLLDLQHDVLDYSLPAAPARLAVLKSTQRTIARARERAVPIVHVVTSFRAERPCVPPENAGLAGIVSRRLLTEGTPGAAVHSLVQPAEDDLVVVKRRAGAFTGTELHQLLTTIGGRRLLLAGVSTSGCVLTTLRQAADLDYEITVLADCCGDASPSRQDFLLADIFPSQAHVIMNGDPWEPD